MKTQMKNICIEFLKIIAKSQNCNGGNWMLWCEEADEKREDIARATAEGRLGSSAKTSVVHLQHNFAAMT